MKRLFNSYIVVITAILLLTFVIAITTLGASEDRGRPVNTLEQATAFSPFWEEDFSAFNQDLYHIVATAGSGSVDNEEFVLTLLQASSRGRIFYLQDTWIEEFSASFSLYFGLGFPDGADGAAFIFCPSYDYAPIAGGALDASCPEGYIVAYDTYDNTGGGAGDQVYVARGNTDPGNYLLQPVGVSNLEDNQWHTSSVVFNRGTITVTLDANTIYAGEVLDEYTPFTGYFGFSAATGGSANLQMVDDIVIQVQFHNYLPTLYKEYCPGFQGPLELDAHPNNNDTPDEADGPLCFNKLYLGSPDNDAPEMESDYFYFLSDGGPFTVELFDFLAAGQLQLYYENSSNLVKYVANQATGDYRLDYSGPGGKYIIRITAPAGHPEGNGQYTLQVIN
jgi:hypothetical protein